MARPRKMTTEQMISVVDSYYLTQAECNEKRLKCSLIAAYATTLGYRAEGYDFARNMEVREHIERMKCFAEVQAEEKTYDKIVATYKSLDVAGFIRTNKEYTQLAQALSELDAYWKRIYEYAEATSAQNKKLMKEKSACEAALKESIATAEQIKAERMDFSSKNNRLSAENRYLRKMLRTYLYPAVADEILRNENEPPQTDTEATQTAVCDFIENGIPKSFESSVSEDNKIQLEAEQLMKRLWEKCDE